VQRVYLSLAVLGACGLLYFGWAQHRISPKVLMYDESWPRRFPHPDGWLLALNNWYDAQYPRQRGTLKMHGELERVRLTVRGAATVAAFVFVSGAVPIALLHIRRLRHGRGFDVLANPGDGPKSP
jgi:hypothetical protein